HCPACKGVTQHSNSLRTLKHADKCPVCSTVFDAGFDTSIEVSFGVNPAIIKPADVDDFAKVIANFDLEPGINIELERGESHYLKTDLKEGNYFILICGEKKALNLVVVSGRSTETQKVSFEYRDNLPLLTIAVAKEGPAELVIVNKERGKKVMTFARLGPQRWPSAAVVSSLQDFRDLFSSEMLSLNETFSIENLGFLFTDLKGSTEMYERLGDAVMAVFTDPQDALRTAVGMIEAFDDLETAAKHERIDYFGTTVNIAARVQGLSDGRDVMATGAIFGESNAAEFLRGKGWSSEPFTTSLKGLKSSYQVHKLHAPNA
ncbi:MAG: DUF5939 domain-containing protein, partial [Spirochaetia bacterium]